MQYILEYSDWLSQKQEVKLDLVQINENFGFGDFLHVLVDVVSAVSDTVVPGTGAVIDFIHAGSYFIQAMIEKGSSQLSLIMQGVITLATMLAIGPLKVACDRLKNGIKQIFEAFLPNAAKAVVDAAKLAAKGASESISSILGVINQIVKGVVDLINGAAQSKLGQWLTSKFGGLAKAVEWFTTFLGTTLPAKLKEVMQLLAKLNPSSVGATGHEGAELIAKGTAKSFASSKAAGATVDYAATKVKATINNVTNSSNQQIAQLSSTSQTKTKTT